MTGFYLALGLRICRAVPLLLDVDIDNFPSHTEKCANTRRRTSDESFDEFCGLFFRRIFCTVMFEDRDFICSPAG